MVSIESSPSWSVLMSKRSSTNPLACHRLDLSTPPAPLAQRSAMLADPCQRARSYMRKHQGPRAKRTNQRVSSYSLDLLRAVKSCRSKFSPPTPLDRVYHRAILILIPRLPVLSLHASFFSSSLASTSRTRQYLVMLLDYVLISALALAPWLAPRLSLDPT